MSSVFPFPQRASAGVHFAGYLLGRIRLIVNEANDPRERISIVPTTQNHLDGTHSARVRIQGDPTLYEMTLRPVGTVA